jgi:hypothetical protein
MKFKEFAMLITSRITLRFIQATFDLKVAWMEAIAAIREPMSIANSFIRPSINQYSPLIFS